MKKSVRKRPVGSIVVVRVDIEPAVERILDKRQQNREAIKSTIMTISAVLTLFVSVVGLVLQIV